MSHVVTIDIDLFDLDALAVAAADCDCELSWGQSHFRWYGEHVGDYPLPQGFTAADMGHCVHAIRSKNHSQAYEIGIVERRDGKAGWMLMYDFYAGGQGMSQVVGGRCERLKQAYAAEVARKKLRKMNYAVKKTRNEQGDIVLVGTR